MLEGLTEHLQAVEAKASVPLPWKGVTYLVPVPSRARHLQLAALLAAYGREGVERVAAVDEVLAGERVEDLIFGREVAEQMHGNNVGVPVMNTLVTIMLVRWVQGEAAAQAYINATAAGEKGPKAQARSKASKTGTSTGAASTTKRRASTSGTKPRRSASPKAAVKGPAAESTSGTSSPAGPSS